jgi:hypothetical protein
MESRLALAPGGRLHGLFASLIFSLDLRLRRRLQVFEYCRNPDCIFRIRIVMLTRMVVLSDGTLLQPGERLIELHLWNEQIPVMPRQGASLSWARQMHDCVDISLRELRRYLASEASLGDVRAVRGNMSFGTREQASQLKRLSARFGFEEVPDPRYDTLLGRLHLFGENILVTLLVLAQNAGALRRDSLLRARTQVFLSRAALENRYRTLPPPSSSPGISVLSCSTSRT